MVRDDEAEVGRAESSVAWRVIQGDVREKLRELPSESVHCCVTSPPYWGLRSYLPEGHELKPLELGNEPTPEEYVQHMVEVFREVKRVLRKDGTLWLNLGDCYAHPGKGGPWDERRSRFNSKQTTPGHMYAQQANRRRVPGLKPKDLVGIPWRVAFALQADGWYLRCDIIWCLSGGTRVYAKTQKGEMPMTIKDLVRLDPSTVKLWNGYKWTQVLGWSQIPRPNVTYEIELRSGERIGCTAGHMWPTQRGNVRTDELQIGDVIQTCHLPEPENVRQPAGLDDDLVGWFVGLYIAEGSRSSDTIQISSHARETERFERLQRLANAYHGTCRMHRTGSNQATINLHGPVLNGIIGAYVAGLTAYDKHLHPRCWQRSNVFLAAVLRGYLSGDGHYDRENNRYRIAFAGNDNWAADLRTLCARLGYSLRLKRTKHVLNGRRFPGYRGQIKFEVSNHHNNRPDGEVIAIRRSRARRFWDIGVEDEPHLFALASGVLTHNSKPNPMPESVTDRPTRSHEYVFLLAKSKKYFYDTDAIREPQKTAEQSEFYDPSTRPDAEEIARRVSDFARSRVRDEAGRFVDMGRDSYNPRDGLQSKLRTQRPLRLLNPQGGNKRSVWTISTQPFPEAHFATFPEKLVEPCILAGTSAAGCCPKCGKPWTRIVEKGEPDREWQARCGADASGGYKGKARKDYAGSGAQDPSAVKARILAGMHKTWTIGWRPTCKCDAGEPIPAVVLDPFAGVLTTLYVAEKLGRDSIGIELNPAYIEIGEREYMKTLAATGVQRPLWA